MTRGLSPDFRDWLHAVNWRAADELHLEELDRREAERAAAEAQRRQEEAEQAELAKLEAEVAEAREKAKEFEPLRRQAAFAEAGVDLNGAGESVAKSYEGELKPEAIRRHVVDLGFTLTGGRGGLRYRLPKEKD